MFFEITGLTQDCTRFSFSVLIYVISLFIFISGDENNFSFMVNTRLKINKINMKKNLVIICVNLVVKSVER